MRSVKCACRMSNPGGSRRNGAMKIRLTSECGALIPTSSGVMRESHGFGLHARRENTYLPTVPTYLSIYLRTACLSLDIVQYGPACAVSFRGEASTRNVKTFGEIPWTNDTSFAVAPSLFWLCAYLFRQRGRPHREHTPGGQWKS